jgi:hypothetical protein
LTKINLWVDESLDLILGRAQTKDFGSRKVDVFEDSSLPGRHITDCQTRLYMKSRQTNVPALAAAKAGFSTATANQLELLRISNT